MPSGAIEGRRKDEIKVERQGRGGEEDREKGTGEKGSSHYLFLVHSLALKFPYLLVEANEASVQVIGSIVH